MAQHAPHTMVLAGLAILLLAMTATDGTLTILPGLLLMTVGGLWDALRDRHTHTAQVVRLHGSTPRRL